MSKVNPLAFLYALRDLHPDLIQVCRNGSCFKLYLLLKQVFPEAEPYYDSDHVIVKIGKAFYDIRGEVLKSPNHIPLDGHLEFNRAYLWGNEDNGANMFPIEQL
jgi:hypothetical protein